MSFEDPLLARFKKQVHFADGYSALYTHLFAAVADWIANRPDDALVRWLRDVSAARQPIEVTLLLMAGLHREVLLGRPAAKKLAQYYPSVGGTARPDGELPEILYHAIWQCRDRLTPFIQNATVQTNETGRGIFWLLPALLIDWEACHVLDLGASAGLNLVADQRGFQLVAPNGRKTQIGLARVPQFTMQLQNDAPPVWLERKLPHILSRTGCDIRPFFLNTPEDHATLTSFIWADQVERIARLREGISAFERINAQSPIALHAVNLPDGLPALLEQRFATRTEPLLVYNTFMTVYLRDHGSALRTHLARFAEQHGRTLLWVQAEPLWDGPAPPVQDWCAWTLDLWRGATHKRWHIAWVHPHGTAVQWREEARNQLSQVRTQ